MDSLPGRADFILIASKLLLLCVYLGVSEWAPLSSSSVGTPLRFAAAADYSPISSTHVDHREAQQIYLVDLRQNFLTPTLQGLGLSKGGFPGLRAATGQALGAQGTSINKDFLD